MTTDKIFSLIAQHMVEGLMVHSQLADFYGFLSLKGYQKCHEYHYFCENKNYRDLCNYYMKHYNKLIKDQPFKNPDVISKDWYDYDRTQVEDEVRKSSIKYGMEKWISWETETEDLYNEYIKELCDNGEVAAALKIEEYLKDTSKELDNATQKWLEVKAIDYCITEIMSHQEEQYKKYKHKLKEIKLC